MHMLYTQYFINSKYSYKLQLKIYDTAMFTP